MKEFLLTGLGEYLNLEKVNLFRVSDKYIMRYPLEQCINSGNIKYHMGIKIVSGVPELGFAGEAVLTDWDFKHNRPMHYQITEVYLTREEAEGKLRELMKMSPFGEKG